MRARRIATVGGACERANLTACCCGFHAAHATFVISVKWACASGNAMADGMLAKHNGGFLAEHVGVCVVSMRAESELRRAGVDGLAHKDNGRGLRVEDAGVCLGGCKTPTHLLSHASIAAFAFGDAVVSDVLSKRSGCSLAEHSSVYACERSRHDGHTSACRHESHTDTLLTNGDGAQRHRAHIRHSMPSATYVPSSFPSSARSLTEPGARHTARRDGCARVVAGPG